MSSSDYIPQNEAEFLEDLGQRVAQIRKKLGLTQNELAQKVGVRQQAIASCEAGSRRVQVFTLAKIIKALYAEPNEILPLHQTPKKRGPQPRIQRDFERILELHESKQHLVSELLDSLLVAQQKAQ